MSRPVRLRRRHRIYEYSEEAMYALNYQSGMGPIW